MNPRTQLSDEYFSLDLVRFYLERIKIKRASNPNAIVPLTNIEVWALARVIDSFEDEYVPKFGGTVDFPYLIEGFKQFDNPLVIPNGILTNHAITLQQLNALETSINSTISTLNTTLINYIDNSISSLELAIVQFNNQFNQRLDAVELALEELGEIDQYVHPSFPPRSLTFLGAEIVSEFESNFQGHVTNVTKRTLTLNDLGYTGAANANFYEHPTGFINLPEIPLSELSVISKLNITTQGHVFGIETRNLTLALFNGEPAFEKGSIITAGGSGISISGTLSNRLVNAGNVTFSLSSDVVREANSNTITGLKTITRSGPNTGASVGNVLKFNIDNSVTLYEMYIKNSQNRNAANGESNWFFTMVENYGGTLQEFDRLSFHRGGTVILGGELPTMTISNDISTWVNANLGTRLPYPISTYVKRGIMVEGRGYFGKNNLTDTLILEASDYLYSNGRIYAKTGFRGANPRDNSLNGPAWELGNAIEDVKTESTHTARIRINGVLYDVLLSEVV